MDIRELLETAVKRRASDLHLVVGAPPVLRIDGELVPLGDQPALTNEQVRQMIFSVVSSQQAEIIQNNRELDFSLPLSNQARLRTSVYFQKGTLAAEFRVIPLEIRDIDELNLPEICHRLAELRQGFVLVTGPVGHGKSTTIAAMIKKISQQRPCHIITIEDPIEFIFPPGKALVSQRELHTDTYSWKTALRSVLREDPDVVFVGEMRDLETIASALTIAETGHLVFSTLHTNSAAQTIDRIIDVFPKGSKEQVGLQLSATIEAVLSQRLVPTLESGRLPSLEVMLGTPAVRTTIREGKTHTLDNIIQTSSELGMMSMEFSLAKLVKEGKVSLEAAQQFALRPEDLLRQVKRK